jgi:hypothetical protein
MPGQATRAPRNPAGPSNEARARSAATRRQQADVRLAEQLRSRGHIVIITYDLADLTARLGLPAHEQEAVQSWTGEPCGKRWTEEEIIELIEAWRIDAERIAAER